MIEFYCPHCGGKLQAEDSIFNTSTVCPLCHLNFQVNGQSLKPSTPATQKQKLSQPAKTNSASKVQLKLIAERHRQFIENLVWVVPAMLVLGMFAKANANAFYFQLVPLSIYAVLIYRLGSALGEKFAALAALVSIFVPCGWVIAVVYYNHHARRRLKEGGVNIGLLGADWNERRKLGR